MGGSVFKSSLGIESKRIDRSQYAELSIKVIEVLDKYFQFTHIIQAYKNKETFGDIDVLVSKPKINVSQLFLKEELKEELIASAVSQNSEIVSYLIDGFQLDVIICPPEEYYTSIRYFDYDPAGNLSGKLAHRFGLRLGHDGLSYILRDNNNAYKLGKITISTNWIDICSFLDLDFDKWFFGFDTQEEIFDWIIKSKYFDARIFSYEEMNHIARTRDRKRQSYNNFMEYIRPHRHRIYEWPLYKEDNLPNIINCFPNSKLMEKIIELKKREEKRKNLTSKYNGNLVMSWTGLKGKELGDTLKKYKEWRGIFSNFKNFDDFLEFTSTERIKEDFMKFYENNKK